MESQEKKCGPKSVWLGKELHLLSSKSSSVSTKFRPCSVHSLDEEGKSYEISVNELR